MKIKITDDIFERVEDENLKMAEEGLSKGMYEEVENLGVLTLIKGGIMTQLNYMGKIIWDAIKNSNTIEDICFKISKDFQVDYDECYCDVKDFIQDLVEKGFIIYEQ